MRQRTSLALAAALLGGLALWQLFPKYDRAAGLGQFPITRAGAIEKARAVARLNGFDTTNWSVSAQAIEWRAGSWIYLWRHLHPAPSVFSSIVTPFVADVVFRQPDGQRFVGVTLTPTGRVVGFGTSTRQSRGSEHLHATETLDAQAEGVLVDFLGPNAALFRPVNRGIAQGRRLLYSWEYSDPADSPHVLRFEASFSEQRLVHAELVAESADSFRAEIREIQAAHGYLITLMAVTVFVVTTLAFPSFFRALVRQRLRWQRLAVTGAVAGLLLVLNFWRGPALDRIQAEAARDFGSALDGYGPQLAGLLVTGLGFVLFYGAGRALVQPEHMARWFAVDALLDRRFGLRLVGSAVLQGLLCGVGLAALPYLVAPFAAPAQPVATSVGMLFYRGVAGAILSPTVLLDIAGVILLAMPLARWMKPRWLAFPVFAIGLSVVWFVLRSPFDDWAGPGLVSGLLLAIGLWLVESEYGALAALVGGAAMVSLWTAAAYWVQPLAAYQRQGGWIVAGLALTAVAAAALMRFGQEVSLGAEVAAMQAESSVEVQSQRDRLSSEFDVARRAQQAMLPPIPAQLGAASFAATCIPARDVGGDLYDFYPTGDGRYAIGVADVSGKGVPASLYMTLTKGFLAAAGRDSNDLLATLSELNSHLYTAGKRKIFVTMAMTFFSPEDRRIELARAGHNSPLWRRAGVGRSEYLTPPGMGLGLTSRLLFERALRLQQIYLEPGDAFVLYSDGITEAMNEQREQFGEERLQAVVDACDGCDAHATEQAILLAVKEFIGSAPPHDDMTLFVVRV